MVRKVTYRHVIELNEEEEELLRRAKDMYGGIKKAIIYALRQVVGTGRQGGESHPMERNVTSHHVTERNVMERDVMERDVTSHHVTDVAITTDVTRPADKDDGVTTKQMNLLVDLLNELREMVTSEEDRAFLDEVDAVLTKLSKGDASRLISALMALKRGDRSSVEVIREVVEKYAEED